MLSVKEIEGKKPDPAKTVRLTDEHGLYLLIRPHGARLWRYDYTFAGRRKGLSFGKFPAVTLARAREKRLEAQRLLDQGLDPSVVRQREKHARIADTFDVVAEEWLAVQARTLTPGTVEKMRGVVTRYLNPVLGARPIATIEPPDVFAALRPIDQAGRHETAHRARQIAGMIFRFAIPSGRATRDPAADLSDALTPVRHTHHAAVTDPIEIGRLLRVIDTCDGSGIVAAALRILPRVFLRPGELRQAEWDHLDLKAALWRVPARLMKSRREHLVPLARQVVTWLRTLQEFTGHSRFVFPSQRTFTAPMSNAAMNAALARLGYGPSVQTPHGFRTIASTRLREIGYDGPLVELQLAHLIGNAVEAAYNRAERLPERVTMMQAYADHLDTLRAAADKKDRRRRA